jgi:uncharacterized protein YraI
VSHSQPVPVLLAIHQRLASVAHARERSCAGLIGLLATIAGPALAQQPPRPDTLAVTTAAVTVRAQPLATARALGRLPASVPVRLYTCADGWCGMSTGQLTGYVLEEYLDRAAQVAAPAQGRGYVNSQGQWVPSPTRTPDNRPPAGATAQCRDGTFSFSRSRRGTCSHHGGVARWL